MKYTLPRSYANAGVAVEIPEDWLRAKRKSTGSMKTAIDTWLVENGYANETECGLNESKPTVSRKREKRADATKAGLIKLIADAVEGEVDSLEIVNGERLIAFSIGADRYEITLSRKRRSKN